MATMTKEQTDAALKDFSDLCEHIGRLTDCFSFHYGHDFSKSFLRCIKQSILDADFDLDTAESLFRKFLSRQLKA